jgi:hypothetical protein
VEVRLRIGPVPHADHDVALFALRPRRGWWQFAGLDAVAPIGQHRQRPAPAKIADLGQHVGAVLPGLHSALPRCRGGIERAEARRNLAGRKGAHQVTPETALGAQPHHPLRLTLHVFGDAVALGAGAGELVRGGHLEHGPPVVRRIVVRRHPGVRRHHGRQVHQFSRRGLNLARIHQPISADPDVVIRFRQIGDDVAPAIVGDHDPDELGRQIGGFRDHPDARFGP